MDSYEEFLLTVRRDINCLSEADRITRKKAAERLQKSLLSGAKVKQEFVVRLFLEELHKPLVRMLGDQAEKCRELSLAMMPQFVDMLEMADLENIMPLLLAGLLGRLRVIPFPETSEEMRLEVLKLLSHLLDIAKEKMGPFTSDVVDALAKALTDSCPDAKKECCEIVKKVSACFDGERLSRAGGPLVASLLGNLRHQQWKVRRATLDSIGVLLSLEEPMLAHMEEALPHLNAPNALLTDRNVAVRQCLAEVLERWLMKGLNFKAPTVAIIDFDDNDPQGFDKYEPRLLLLLLSTIADEDTEQVAPLAFGSLERVAALKHEVRLNQLEKQKEKAAKMKKANKTEDEGPALEEVTLAPEFDYSTVKNLLPAPFTESRLPVAKTTTYVKLHLATVLPQVFSNMTGWTADIRSSAARLLRVVLVLVNHQIAPFLDAVLVHLYKSSADDDPAVAKSALECAEMLGAFVQVDLILGLVTKHLGLRLEGSGQKGQSVEDLFPETRTGRTTQRTVQDVTSGVKNFTALSVENKRQVLTVLAHLLRPAADGAPARLKLDDVRMVIRFLEEGGSGEDLLPWSLGAIRSLLHTGGRVCCDEWPRIFDLLLRMRSTEECDHAAVDSCMDYLGELCGHTRRQLYEEHLRTQLGELLSGADCELWEERSAKRHVLETLLRNSGAAVAEHLGPLASVIARQASPEDAPVPARIDLLGLVHFLVTEGDPAVIESLRGHSGAYLEGVLIPNCIWRAGQSNNKIRKGGMVCIHALLKQHLVSPAVLNSAFSDLLPILKSCLDDSFSPDNRLIACLVLACLLSELQAEISAEQLREVYPEMLKRLDDSNDKIRAVVCEALSVFFKCLPPKWSRSLYEYILRTLFVHLDDPNPEIQQGIYGVLETAVHQDYAAFAAEARVAVAKSAHPRMCEELLRLSQSLQQADLDGQFGSSSTGYPAATD
jgi:dynein assembly factor 5